MTYATCESKLRSVVRSGTYGAIHAQETRSIGHAVVNYARAAHVFSARIKCRHCIYIYIYTYDITLVDRALDCIPFSQTWVVDLRHT